MVGDTCGGTMRTHTHRVISPHLCSETPAMHKLTQTQGQTHVLMGFMHEVAHTFTLSHRSSQSQPEVCVLQLAPSHTQVNRSAQTLVYRLTGPDPAL